MKTKQQLKYLLDRAFLDCSDIKSGEISMDLLLGVTSADQRLLLTDGFHAIAFEEKISSNDTEAMALGSLSYFRGCRIEIIGEEEEIDLFLRFEESVLLMPERFAVANFRMLRSDLNSSEVAFLKNSLFEKKVRIGDGDNVDNIIMLDELLETTAESLDYLQKRVKAI